MSDKSQDVALILKLYELRREEGIRRARKWYFTEFNPQSAEDIVKTFTSGHDGSAYFRMITSYWEMAASFVNNGGIDEKMFLDANGEHVGVFSKIVPIVLERRRHFLELAVALDEHMFVGVDEDVADRRIAKERLERMRGVFARWAKVAQQASSAS